MLNDKGRLRTSLYKALLFLEIAMAIKSIQLYFTCCYQVQVVEARAIFVEKAGMSQQLRFCCCRTVFRPRSLPATVIQRETNSTIQ